MTNLPLNLDEIKDKDRLLVFPFDGGTYDAVYEDHLKPRLPSDYFHGFQSLDVRPFGHSSYYTIIKDMGGLEADVDGVLMGPLIIVDEVGLAFSGVDLSAPENLKILEFMRAHRHARADMVFLAQDHGQLPPELKRLCKFFIEISNLKTFGVSRWIERTYQTHYGKRTALKTEQGTYESWVFECYRSHDLGSLIEGEGEANLKGISKEWWKYKTLWLVVAITIVAAYFSIMFVSRFVIRTFWGETYTTVEQAEAEAKPAKRGWFGGGREAETTETTEKGDIDRFEEGNLVFDRLSFEALQDIDAWRNGQAIARFGDKLLVSLPDGLVEIALVDQDTYGIQILEADRCALKMVRFHQVRRNDAIEDAKDVFTVRRKC